MTLARDEEPLPTDHAPGDLLAALARRKLSARWQVLRPSRRRELVEGVLEAKKPETRARRIDAAITELEATRPKRAR